MCRLPNSGIQKNAIDLVKFEVVECREKYETCNATKTGSLPSALPGLENIYGYVVFSYFNSSSVILFISNGFECYSVFHNFIPS